MNDSFQADRNDAAIAVQDALNFADMTADELVAAARTGDFPTLRARIAWVAIGGELLAERGEI